MLIFSMWSLYMLKDLIKMAGYLDSLGLRREANIVDALIRKVAGDKDLPFDSASYIAGRIEPDRNEFSNTFDSASYIAGRREPSRPDGSYRERSILISMGFSPLNMDDVNSNIQSMFSAGEYNYKNGCYIVVPRHYPDVEPMIYDQNQDQSEGDISYFITPENGYYLNKSLPVPG